MRSILILALLGAVAVAQAERLILIPTGKKYAKGMLRTEWLLAGKHPDDVQWFLGTGIGDSFDAEILYERLGPNPHVSSVNFAYNYLVPVVNLTPGISFGVRDLMNKTADRRSLYLATTFRIGLDGDYNSDVPMELTIGVGTESIKGLFVGVMIPASENFRLLAEHDSLRITAGFEIRPVKGFGFRALFRENRTLWGLNYEMRF